VTVLAYRCAGCGKHLGAMRSEYICPRAGIQTPHQPVSRRTRPQPKPAEPAYTRPDRALRRRRKRRQTQTLDYGRGESLLP
jgi:hypothetical protein